MSEIVDRTVMLEGLPFHYREAGSPGAPPVVLLHALGLDAHDWDAITLALADQAHVFALDQRGHGESARPDNYSFEAMRDDLKAFVDSLSLERFTLIGHSMGGTVAYLFAERWPERVDRLVIEDTPPPVAMGRQEAARVPDEPPQPVPFDWRLLKPIMRQLDEPDPAWWADLPKITAPTLLIGGGPSSPVPQEKLAEVAQLIPDCRLTSLGDAGHHVHRAFPDAYVQAVRGFLYERNAS